MKTTNPFIASVADQSGEMVELIPQDSQTLTADDGLLPCPFCGGTNLYAYRNIVECRKPECGGTGPDVGDTRLPDAAKDAWNARAALNQGQG